MQTQKHLITLTLFACTTLCIAQQNPPSTSAPTLTLTIPKEYSSTEGRFKVVFPSCRLNEIDETPDSKMGKVPFHMVLCVSNSVTYSVVYVDYPIILDTPDLVKHALDNAREGTLSRIAKEDPRIVKEADISVEGHPGRFLQVVAKGDAIVHMRYFIASSRVYSFGAGTPKRQGVEATKYESLATNFMDSFKLISPLEADLSGTWKEYSSTEGKYKVQFPGTPVEFTLPAGDTGTWQAASYRSAVAYSATYLDYFETPKDVVAVIELLDGLRLGEFDMAVKAGMNPKLISERSMTFDGYPGRDIVLEFSNDQIYRRKMFVVKNRVYIASATGPRDDPNGEHSYEALSLKFINSFTLTERPVKN